ncbi:hypothetical protein GOV03_04805 [Candidatus Woesearchaeota archaeon]|nr:hypothetical protein [Candidatus Woesearchaeota archaeon]
MNDPEKILSLIRTTGPILPNQAAKCINSNILLASAYLSELSSQGKIKVSRIKIGGSPLYYLLEHKEKLQNFTHNLNPKDQEILNSLKEKKILRERYLDLLTRVSLRKIKDFAIPLNININNNRELFWKWYLITDSEATELIRAQLAPPKETPPPAPQPVQPTPPTPQPEAIPPQPKPQSPPTQPEPSKKEEQPPAPENPVLDKNKKPLLQKIKEKFKQKPTKEHSTPKKRKVILDEFFPKVDSFFKERDIQIESKDTIRKNSEIDFLVKVPSVVGKIIYFCKAKNKKRCDEKDISAAYMMAQSKKHPLLFLYTNEITKKAQEMLDSNAFENLVVKKLG